MFFIWYVDFEDFTALFMDICSVNSQARTVLRRCHDARKILKIFLPSSKEHENVRWWGTVGYRLINSLKPPWCEIHGGFLLISPFLLVNLNKGISIYYDNLVLTFVDGVVILFKTFHNSIKGRCFLQSYWGIRLSFLSRITYKYI